MLMMTRLMVEPTKETRRAGGPPSASIERAVAQSIPKPHPVKTAKVEHLLNHW
jgi:hypothetical protein